MDGTPAVPVIPRRAPVVPRVRPIAGGESLTLERRARDLIRNGFCGRIGIAGRAGSGKSIALQHLAWALSDEKDVQFVDDGFVVRKPERGIVFFSVAAKLDYRHADFEMFPWGDDDLIEYLVATHRAQCHSVMFKVKSFSQHLCLGGSPELWRMVLDTMASDPSIPDVGSALRRCLAPQLSDPKLFAGHACLKHLQNEKEPDSLSLVHLLPPTSRRLAMHRPVQLLLASEVIVRNLCDGVGWASLGAPLPHDLIIETARLAAHWPDVVDRLLEMLASNKRRVHPMAASLLLAIRPEWKPAGTPMLTGAHVAGAHWAGVDLHDTTLNGADLERADLSGANLSNAQANDADFRGASLRDARLEKLLACKTNLAGAALSGVSADGAKLCEANLHAADLRFARLRGADLTQADLSDAILTSANLCEAVLVRTNISGTDLVGVDLSRATLDHVRLCDATLSATDFSGATLRACELEGVFLAAANFTGARLAGCYMTATRMPRASFRRADLRNTGLAEIDWEGADLRDADLRGVSFHMGSTRSGLVGSTIAGEGSKTGFYTDDFQDRDFKNPEEIRTANLCDADLRGAQIGGVDFYLVDLRGAIYTADQHDQFKRCGAILG